MSETLLLASIDLSKFRRDLTVLKQSDDQVLGNLIGPVFATRVERVSLGWITSRRDSDIKWAASESEQAFCFEGPLRIRYHHKIERFCLKACRSGSMDPCIGDRLPVFILDMACDGKRRSDAVLDTGQLTGQQSQQRFSRHFSRFRA